MVTRIIIICLIFGSSLCYSQNWVFRITPNLKPCSLGFFKTSYVSSSNGSFVFEQIQPSSFDNMVVDINPSMDLILELYDWGKWSFGLGFGRLVTFNRISVSTYGGYGSANSSSIYYNYFGYGESTTFSTELRTFSLSVRRKFNPFNNKTNHSLQGQLNFGYNTIEEIYEEPSTYIPFSNPYLYIQVTNDGYYKGLGKRQRGQIGLSLRYEVAFISKKNKNLLNLNVTYFQGFIKTDYYNTRLEVFDSNPSSSYIDAITTSRNAHLSIGLSKTFSFNFLKNNKIKF
jgi:hypothetical protein